MRNRSGSVIEHSVFMTTSQALKPGWFSWISTSDELYRALVATNMTVVPMNVAPMRTHTSPGKMDMMRQSWFAREGASERM